MDRERLAIAGTPVPDSLVHSMNLGEFVVRFDGHQFHVRKAGSVMTLRDFYDYLAGYVGITSVKLNPHGGGSLPGFGHGFTIAITSTLNPLPRLAERAEGNIRGHRKAGHRDAASEAVDYWFKEHVTPDDIHFTLRGGAYGLASEVEIGRLLRAIQAEEEQAAAAKRELVYEPLLGQVPPAYSDFREEVILAMKLPHGRAPTTRHELEEVKAKLELRRRTYGLSAEAAQAALRNHVVYPDPRTGEPKLVLAVFDLDCHVRPSYTYVFRLKSVRARARTRARGKVAVQYEDNYLSADEFFERLDEECAQQ